MESKKVMLDMLDEVLDLQDLQKPCVEIKISDVDYRMLYQAKHYAYLDRKGKYGRYAMKMLEGAIKYCHDTRARDQEIEFWES